MVSEALASSELTLCILSAACVCRYQALRRTRKEGPAGGEDSLGRQMLRRRRRKRLADAAAGAPRRLGGAAASDDDGEGDEERELGAEDDGECGMLLFGLPAVVECR
jgi:hypothetical protein